MNWLIMAPVLAPFIGAIATGLRLESPAWRRRCGLSGVFAQLVFALFLFVNVMVDGPQAAQMGGWPAPFGITLVVDMFSALLILVTALIGCAIILYAIDDIDSERKHYGFYPLLLFMLGAVCGSFTTGDLFNLYVWYEIIVISSFALLVLGGDARQTDGALKYVCLNIIATTIFLIAIAMLYGVTGTLNMADLRESVATISAASDQERALLISISVLFILGFGMKAALFPMFSWLPASYHTPPVAVSAAFGGLMTKVGVYSLFRLFTLIYTPEIETYPYDILLFLGVMSIIVGGLGAIVQTDIRRMLGFLVISGIGTITLGLGLASEQAMSAAIFYLVHDMLVKAALFLAAGLAIKVTGTSDIRSMGGLVRNHGSIAAFYMLGAFALMGFPPLSGFWAKLAVVQSTMQAEAAGLTAVVLIGSFLNMIPLIRVWSEAFWSPKPQISSPLAIKTISPIMSLPTGFLLVLIVVIGLEPKFLYGWTNLAAAELARPTAYVGKVFANETAVPDLSASKPQGDKKTDDHNREAAH